MILFFDFLLRIYLEFPSRMLSTYTFVNVSVIQHANAKFYLRLLKHGKSIRSLEKFKVDNLKKKLISGFNQPLVRANQQLIESSWLINYATTDTQATNEIELY
jgi:hypothetical protein